MAKNYSHGARWKHEQLFERGYLAVPITFLEYYARLKRYGGLTHSEGMFILQVMAFKWDSREPYPSYTTLAERMGTSPKTIQRHAKALEDKGYLYRVERRGSSNAFELTPLFDSLLEAVTEGDSTEPRAA